jgi:hypothetical protein
MRAIDSDAYLCSSCTVAGAPSSKTAFIRILSEDV